jgi:hypothetical protein
MSAVIPDQHYDELRAERDRLKEALERLQMGPDTLTQDGLRIVLDALYPEGGDRG